MMSNNKILTVSYGTFSCTLEGFDDSFGTMKAIAEYFRDLASDDRYFGAEPPQPDAEMLARIAQKEISRRVEAREHEGKIVLSASQAETGQTTALPKPEPEAPAPSAPQADAEPTPVPRVEAAAPPPVAEAKAPAPAAETPATAPQAEAEKPVAPADEDDTDIDAFFAQSGTSGIVVEEDPDADTAEPPARQTESIAAKLQRIRAVVSQQDVQLANDVEEDEAPVAAKPREETETVAWDEVQDEDDLVATPQDEETAASSEDDAPDAPVLAETDAQDTAPLDISDEMETEEPQEVQDTAAAESDAQEVIASADPVLMSDPVAAARRDIEEALDADAAADTEIQNAYEEEADDDEDDIAAILARLERGDVPGRRGTMRDGFANGSGSREEIDASDLNAIENLFGISESDPSDDEADDAQDASVEASASRGTENAEPEIKQPEAVETETEAAVEENEEAAESATSDPVRGEGGKPRGRVITVSRDALDAAMESGELEAYEPAQQSDEAARKDTSDKATSTRSDDDNASKSTSRSDTKVRKTSSLTTEEEEELARELAQVEADDRAAKAAARASAGGDADRAVTAPEAFASDEDDAEEQAAAHAAARSVLPEIEDGTDTNMSRLMAETDHQMDEPESATRRDAFAHLRAAVAAKKADQALGGSQDEDESDDAYRSDLAEVVRPRRPEAPEGARRQRPGEGRPAPLKLVAEQRIDAERARPAGPVSPRRVAAVTEVTEDEGDRSFADFASDMGATRLPDLLEAAASYMAFVEGKEQFSRPQLMTKVRQAQAPDFSREDGLRSFGQLLRAGKIEKIKGGQFTVSDDIGFKPDQRAAG